MTPEMKKPLAGFTNPTAKVPPPEMSTMHHNYKPREDMAPHLLNVLSRFEDVTRSNDGWMALCRAHDDANPSLSIKVTDDGRILVHCFAGCDTADVVAAAGLKMSDLRASRVGKSETKRRLKALGPVVMTYDYCDEHGNLLYQATRHDPKAFRQRRPDGNDGWIPSIGDLRRVPYRLPELLAADSSKIVWWVEGEKDVETLRALGEVATTSVGGSNSFRPEYAQHLLGRSVCVVADNDEAGEIYAEQVAASCDTLGILVRVLRLSNLPKKGDVSDFFAAGGTVEELTRWCEATTPWKPSIHVKQAASHDEPEIRLFGCNDVGNAERLIYRFGERLRHCARLGGWLIWNGKIWKRDDTCEIVEYMKKAMDAIPAEASLISNQQEKAELLRWAAYSLNAARIKAGIELAKSDRKVVRHADQFDANQWLFNVGNGTIDTEAKDGRVVFRGHDPADQITKMAPVFYDPNATAPTWEKFLASALPDVDVRGFLARYIGYALTGEVTEKALMLVVGESDTGKTTAVETIQQLFGEDYGAAAAESTISAQKFGDGISNDMARLWGKRLVTVSETSEGSRLNTPRLKAISGRSKITARFLHQEFFEFVPRFKLIIETNFAPIIQHSDGAIWNRLKIVGFDHVVPKSEMDPLLPKKLMSELPGILNCAIAGCLDWQARGGLDDPKSVSAAVRAYRETMSPVQEFLVECCVVHLGAKVAQAALYQKYTEWAMGAGLRAPLKRKEFSEAILRIDRVARGKGTGNASIFDGVGLIPSEVRVAHSGESAFDRMAHA